MDISKTTTIKNCLIYCDSFPTFLLSRSFLQMFCPTVVVCAADIHQHIVSISSPDVLIVTMQGINFQDLGKACKGADIAFATGRLNATIMNSLISLGVSSFLSTHTIRRRPSTWNVKPFTVVHKTYGGVTDGAHRFYFYCQDEIQTKDVSHLYHSRDAYTIIEDTVWCKNKQRRPESVFHGELKVVEVGSSEKPLIHIGGLLPLKELRSCTVITPSIGLSSTVWGVRQLTSMEIFTALDLSPDFLKSSLPLNIVAPKPVIPALSWIVAALRYLNVGENTVYNQGCSKRFSKKYKKEVIGAMKLGVEQEKVSEILGGIKLEQSAIKSDDAIVNTDIWFNQFLDNASYGDVGLSDKYKDEILTPPVLKKCCLSFRHSDVGALRVHRRWELKHAMNVMRKFLLWRWKRKVMRDFLKYYHDTCRKWDEVRRNINYRDWLMLSNGKLSWSEQGRDAYKMIFKNRTQATRNYWMKGSDAVRRALKSSWWEWEEGSSPFYWRWPSWYQRYIRDGIRFPLKSTPPEYLIPQADERDKKTKALMTKKLHKVIERGYIGKGEVKSLTSFFSVRKGNDDIRMVYNGTINGFNDCVEVPRFGMPTLKSHLRSMMPGYFMADADVGECFLNFHLHEDLQPYTGVDVEHYIPSDGDHKNWLRWLRAGMGFKSSPYQSCQGMMVAEEVIKGNHRTLSNPFHWDKVILNLPGCESFDPSIPWVCKIRVSDGKVACDFYIYVDDIRVTGSNGNETSLSCRKVTSLLNWLGIQDAPRKRRKASRMAGAWAGSVIYTTAEEVFVLVTEEKWIRGRGMLLEVKEGCKRKMMNRKRLQQIRGYLNYICNTYPILSSYLMGFHLTIDGWRPGRDKEGWKYMYNKYFSEDEIRDDEYSEEEYLDNDIIEESKGPMEVKVKSRLKDDVDALLVLMNSEMPPLRKVRTKHTHYVYYGFGDASGSAYGVTLSAGETLQYQYGQWCMEMAEESSNWRELRNLVDALKNWNDQYSLRGSVMFLFTDNTTVESTFWKGTSKSKKLFELILDMKRLSLQLDLQLYVIHVSGKRMIDQGTDGLS